MLALAVSAAAGILLRDFFWKPPAWALFWLFAGAAVMAARRRRFEFVMLAVTLGFCQLHGWSLAESREHLVRAILRACPQQQCRAVLRGSLLPPRESAAGETGLAVLDFHQAALSGGAPARMRGRVRVQLPPGFKLAAAGDYEIEGRLRIAPPPMNPGQFDFASFSLRKGWAALLEAERVRLVEHHSFAPKFAFLQAAESCRAWIIRQLTHGIPAENPHGAVILAMTLGVSEAAGEEVADAFRGSGTLHVFAISGLHVMMLAAILLWGARALGYQRGVILVIVLLFGYAFITGWRPSAARASVMAAMLLVAPLLNRKNRLANTLGASALLLLLMDTQQLFMAGFQLSFGVLLGITLLASPLMEKLKPWYEMDPFLPPQVAGFRQRAVVKARTGIVALATVSLAAWTGSLPFMLGHFRTMTPVALLANLLLVPAAGFCLAFACASLLLGALQLAWLSALVNQCNAALASLMVWSAGQFAALPGANFSVDLRLVKSSAPVELRVFHLPGGGQAAHLRGGDRHWLLDTGNEKAWRSVVLPWFRSQGVNRLDGIILSHADIAHAGAAPKILDAMNAPRLYTSQLEPWRFDPPDSSLRRLTKVTRPDGAVWHRAGLDETLALSAEPAVSARVLHPGHSDRHEKADDRGLVLMLEHGGMRVLWLNDAGFVTTRRLAQRNAGLRCDIILQSHHKTDLDGLADLLPAASPRVVILGSPEPFSRPESGERLRRECARLGIHLLETELTGSVSMEFERDGAVVKSFHDRQEIRLPAVNARGGEPSTRAAEE